MDYTQLYCKRFIVMVSVSLFLFFILLIGVALSLFTASKDSVCFNAEAVDSVEKDVRGNYEIHNSDWSIEEMPTYKSTKKSKLALVIRYDNLISRRNNLCCNLFSICLSYFKFKRY